MTLRRAALLLTVASGALLGATAARAGDGPDGGGADGGQAAASGADAGTGDPDQEILDHLDEVQNLELLQNLELFDPKLEEK